jgi:serine/threonine protein kinase
VQELPDWGKLVFREQAPRGMADALPGASPAALQLVEGLLRYSPAQRLSAQAALDSPYFREEPAPAPPQALAAVVRQLLD